MIPLFALAAGFPLLGGPGSDSEMYFWARIDCDVRSDDGSSRLSFLFPESELSTPVETVPSADEFQKFPVLLLNALEDGRTFLVWKSASAVPARPIARSSARNVPVPLVPNPIITFDDSFEMLAPTGSNGNRWSYSNTVLSSDGGPTYNFRGNCRMAYFEEAQ